jgi:hypothetical protein
VTKDRQERQTDNIFYRHAPRSSCCRPCRLTIIKPTGSTALTLSRLQKSMTAHGHSNTVSPEITRALSTRDKRQTFDIIYSIDIQLEVHAVDPVGQQ